MTQSLTVLYYFSLSKMDSITCRVDSTDGSKGFDPKANKTLLFVGVVLSART